MEYLHVPRNLFNKGNNFSICSNSIDGENNCINAQNKENAEKRKSISVNLILQIHKEWKRLETQSLKWGVMPQATTSQLSG